MNVDPSIYRLEGTSGQSGGLIIRKKNTDGDKVFKVPAPKASLLGLDRLAEERRKQKDQERKVASNILLPKKSRYDEDTESSEDKKRDYHKRKYRRYTADTPSYSSGVSEEYLQRQHNRKEKEKQSKGLYASSKHQRHHEKRGDREYHDEHGSERSHSRQDSRSGRKSSHRSIRKWRESPCRRGEPASRRIRPKDTPSRSAWDDDEPEFSGHSTWDKPSPSNSTHRSHRSNRTKSDYSDTPAPTPAHRYNTWANDRKRTGATPMTLDANDEKVPWSSKEDKLEWEKNDQHIDRKWCYLDEAYDDTKNPFADMSSEYTRKKEEERRKKIRMSSRQRQVHKVNEKWEANRMLTSGVVTRLDHDDDFEEDNEVRVHLFVHNLVPPFLDGRIVFTKQPEPLIPVKDPTSDMAVISRNGSAVVRSYREQKERRKAQKKEWNWLYSS